MAARRTRKLPFVVQPKLQPIMTMIGTEVSGQFEIKRQGYLTVAEKAFVQGSESEDETSQMIHGIAIRIGGALNQEPAAVLKRISAGDLTGELAPYTGEIMACVNKMQEFAERHTLIVATCMMVHRIDPKWEVEDTLELHPDILHDLEMLYNDEERQTLDALMAAQEKADAPEEEAELGKD